MRYFPHLDCVKVQGEKFTFHSKIACFLICVVSIRTVHVSIVLVACFLICVVKISMHLDVLPFKLVHYIFGSCLHMLANLLLFGSVYVSLCCLPF